VKEEEAVFGLEAPSLFSVSGEDDDLSAPARITSDGLDGGVQTGQGAGQIELDRRGKEDREAFGEDEVVHEARLVERDRAAL